MGYPVYQDVKLYLGISSTKDDALLVATLRRAIAIFENLAHRSFVPTTATRYFSADSDQVLNAKELFIRDGDLLSITTLQVDGVSVPQGEFFLPGVPPFFKIKIRKTSDFDFTRYTGDPDNSISVVGTWGYDVTVPQDVGQAIVRLTAFLYQQKDNALELDRPVAVSNAMILPAAIPADVKAIAESYRRIMA